VPIQRLQQTEDEELIELCHQEQRKLVTLDMGFANPLQFQPSQYAGIAVLRLLKKPNHEDLLTLMRTLVQGLVREELRGKL
jgi:hypothetical protein